MEVAKLLQEYPGSTEEDVGAAQLYAAQHLGRR
jgi:hypothetical protein